jgi:hypothetical protein
MKPVILIFFVFIFIFSVFSGKDEKKDSEKATTSLPALLLDETQQIECVDTSVIIYNKLMANTENQPQYSFMTVKNVFR